MAIDIAAQHRLDRRDGGAWFGALLAVSFAFRPPAAEGPAPGANTTIALVATDAALTKAQCKQLAVMARERLCPRHLAGAHPLDGDTIFAAATGKQPLTDQVFDLALIGSAVVATLAHLLVGNALPGGCPVEFDLKLSLTRS